MSRRVFEVGVWEVCMHRRDPDDYGVPQKVWTVERKESDREHIPIASRDEIDDLLKCLKLVSDGLGEQEARQRLHGSAPSLLEALQELHGVTGCNRAAYPDVCPNKFCPTCKARALLKILVPDGG